MESSPKAYALGSILSCCLYIIIIVLFPISSWAACTGSSPHWTSTADYSSVSTCAARASAGDIITVSGNATWSSTLTLTRGVKLVGSGNPTITREGVAINWTPNAAAQAAHDTLSITGFTFNANNTNLGGMGVIYVANTSATNYVYLTIKSNTIKNVAASGRGIYLSGTIYGYAALNTFDRVAIIVGSYGDDAATWANLTQAYGTANNFYVEDNTIIFSSSYPAGYSGWTESGQGGRTVFRYNTWDYTNAVAPGEFWDIHGLQTATVTTGPPEGCINCQNYSTMVSEYYGNKIINQVNAYRWMAHRGGWMLLFYNTLAGNTSPYNGITQYVCNPCGSGGHNQKATNTYAWRNFANSTEKPLTYYSPGEWECLSDPLIENTDYFNYNPSFNGTAGLGCGTLAARPTTCTTGVGYWATNQSCSNLTGMVGANPTTPISGTLYKCTATNTWAAYYTPYSYPHPLRTGSVLLSAPNGIRVIRPQ